jgi:hypothetical protein
MVKAVARMPDGRVLLVLGISAVNVDRLRQGQPIHFDPSTLQIAPGETIGGVVLFYKPHDQDLARELTTLIGPDTEVIAVPHGDDRPQ